MTDQYKDLQALYEKYNSKGLEVLGFPCNQFGAQEPDSDAEIKQFVEKNYSVTFPMFSKIEVNGPNTDPVFNVLKNDRVGTHPISWNFEKFLVDKEGRPIYRYPTKLNPKDIEKDIVALLGK